MNFNLNDYEMVKDRLPKWWADNPDGALVTEMLVDRPDYCVFECRLYRTIHDPKPTATGSARTIYDTNRQTREFGLELAETSAIGRALANYIYAGTQRASAEEMSKITKDAPNKFEKKLETKVEVENPKDPWTIQEKPMPLTTSEIMDEFKKDGIGVEEVPMCPGHNKSMQLKSGNKNGKEWRGYKRAEWPNACPNMIWMEIDKSGKWVLQRPRPKQGELS